MKKSVVSCLTAVVLAAFLTSCVSMQDRVMTEQEQAEATIIDTVTTRYINFSFLHIPNTTRIRNSVYAALMRNARQKYQGNIEIKNIKITSRMSGLQTPFIAIGAAGGLIFSLTFDEDDPASGAKIGIPIAIGINLIGNVQLITATGDVVLVDGDVTLIESAPSGNTAPVPANMQRMDAAINAAALALINDMPANATIAVLSVYSDDRSAAEYVIDELEYRFVRSRKFKVVDRLRLEQIRREQNFQVSGNVDDNSAVSIGKMLGASIVITGNVSSEGNTRRLVLRALDVQTAQIILMARERF